MANDFTKNVVENLDTFNVHVPHDKVLQAFKAGIVQAEEEKIVPLKKPHKKLKKVIWIPLVVATAASLILAAGKVNPALAKTFVNIPWIGQYFKANQDQLGTELLNSGRLFDINQPETIDKTTVTIDKAYYQASVVTVYGHVKGGNIIPKKEADEISWEVKSPVAWENTEGYDHVGNGYTFNISFELKNPKLSKELDFPFTIRNINEATGLWKYNLHLTQKLGQTIPINQKFVAGGYQNQPWSIDKVVEGDKLSELYVTNNPNLTGLIDSSGKNILHTELCNNLRNNGFLKTGVSIYVIEGTIKKGELYKVQPADGDTAALLTPYNVVLRP